MELMEAQEENAFKGGLTEGCSILRMIMKKWLQRPAQEETFPLFKLSRWSSISLTSQMMRSMNQRIWLSPPEGSKKS
jgi:hypothetical protein